MPRQNKKDILEKPTLPKELTEIEFPCIELKQGKFRLLVFKATPQQLWSIVDINKRDPDKKTGYQRVLSVARVEVLAKFIKAGNPLPNNILVAFDKENDGSGAVFKNNKLIIPNRSNAGWVIDGQHRLVAAHLADEKIDLLVAAFIGLDVQEQIKQFVTINREAKGVPTSLYYDLLKQLPPGKNSADVARERSTEIADTLKRSDESPFFGRVTVVNSPGRGEISLTNFVRKVSPLLNSEKGRLRLFSFKEQIQIINNYFIVLKNLFPQFFRAPKPLFMQTLGFGAWMNVFPYVFDVTYNQSGGGFSVSDATSTLQEFRDFDFASWESRGSGSQAETEAGFDLETHLRFRLASDETSSSIRLF